MTEKWLKKATPKTKHVATSKRKQVLRGWDIIIINVFGKHIFKTQNTIFQCLFIDLL